MATGATPTDARPARKRDRAGWSVTCLVVVRRTARGRGLAGPLPVDALDRARRGCAGVPCHGRLLTWIPSAGSGCPAFPGSANS
jgi:hypothetical protein